MKYFQIIDRYVDLFINEKLMFFPLIGFSSRTFSVVLVRLNLLSIY